MVINLSLEARTVSLTMMLLVLSYYFLLKANSTDKKRYLILFVLFTVMSFYTHYLSVYTILVLLMMALLYPFTIKQKIVGLVLTGFLITPIMYYLIGQKISNGVAWLPTPSFDDFIIQFQRINSTGSLMIIVLIGLASSLYFGIARINSAKRLIFGAISLGPLVWVFSFFGGQFLSSFNAKYLFYTVPFILIASSIGIYYLINFNNNLIKFSLLISLSICVVPKSFEIINKNEYWKSVVSFAKLM